jgi:group I intron endonuclease
MTAAGDPSGWLTARFCSSFNSIPTSPGIYAIRNLFNGKRYIGSTVNLRSRAKAHRTCLRGGYHHSKKLQRAWNKYGENAFVFEVMECCAASRLDSLEGPVIAAYDVVRLGYNMLYEPSGDVDKRTHGAEARSRISKALTGRVLPETVKAKLRGQIISQETRQKLSQAWKPHTLKTRLLLSRMKKGKPLTEDHKTALRGKRGPKRAISESKVGDKNPNFGKPRTETTRAAIAETNRRTKQKRFYALLPTILEVWRELSMKGPVTPGRWSVYADKHKTVPRVSSNRQVYRILGFSWEEFCALVLNKINDLPTP